MYVSLDENKEESEREKDRNTIYEFSLQYYPRMTRSPFDMFYFVPVFWLIVRIRIKRVKNNSIVWIDAYEYDREQVIFPS